MSYISYSQSEFPPFPALRAEFEYLLNATRSVTAKIDTGASRTIVPERLLEEVGAIRTGRVVFCQSYDGDERQWPVYEVTIRVCDDRWPGGLQREFANMRVLGVKGQTEVLLGRDILAAWNLHLDGPNSRYAVE